MEYPQTIWIEPGNYEKDAIVWGTNVDNKPYTQYIRADITTQLAKALEGCIAMLKKDSIDSEVAYYTGMMGEEDPVKYAQAILARYHGGNDGVAEIL